MYSVDAKNNRFETGMNFNISKPLKYATIVFRSKNLCHSGNLPNLGQASASEAEKYSSTSKKFAQTSASEAEKYGVKKRNLPQYFEAGKNYAACVKKKGQSTCVLAIDDSADTF